MADDTRTRIIQQAQARQGTPYRLDPPPDGIHTLDCSLFVLQVLASAGVPLPSGVRTAEQIRQATLPVPVVASRLLCRPRASCSAPERIWRALSACASPASGSASGAGNCTGTPRSSTCLRASSRAASGTLGLSLAIAARSRSTNTTWR